MKLNIERSGPIFNLIRPALKIGFTCGAFDLLHAGHALMFEECKTHCNYLIVGVQSDPSLDRQGKNRPVQMHEERIIMTQSIKWVDEVVTYDTEEDLIMLLKDLKQQNLIDIRIIGSDWKDKRFTGDDLGIPVVYNSRDHGYSTSELRKRIAAAEYLKNNT